MIFIIIFDCFRIKISQIIFNRPQQKDLVGIFTFCEANMNRQIKIENIINYIKYCHNMTSLIQYFNTNSTYNNLDNMTPQIQYFNSYSTYENLLKDIFNNLSDNENKIQYDIVRLHIYNQDTMYESRWYVPFDHKSEPATDYNIELTIKIYMISENYESFKNLHNNNGEHLATFSPCHLKNKLFFPDGTKKYELNNILYRFFYMIKNIKF